MSNKLWIQSHLKEGSRSESFSFLANADQAGCGGVLHGENGNVTAPLDQNGKYRNGLRCTWDIEAQSGYRIEIDFVGRFDIEQSDDCDNDFVKVNYILNMKGT